MENETTEQKSTEGAAGNNEQQQNVVKTDVVLALKGLASEESLQTLSKVVNKEQEKKETPANDGKKEEGSEGGTEKGAEDKKEVVGEKTEAEKKDDAKTESKKSAFGFDKKKKEAEQIVIENPEQILGVIKTKFGQEFKNISELPKFFENVNKWRNDAQKAEEHKQLASQYEEIVNNLPPEIHQSIKAFYDGEDYSKPFTNKPKFDYSKPAEKQDVKELVNHYFPGKFTEEDFKDETKSAALEIAEESAITKFNLEKKEIDDQRAKATDKANKQIESLKASVIGSVNHLKQSFPDASEKDVLDIQKTLEGGAKKLLSFFFNEDGTYTQDAAEKLMWAINGKQEVEILLGAATSQAESKVKEEIVSRSSDKAKPVKPSQSLETLSPEAQKKINELRQLNGQRNY
jgi:hypothetical protein